MQFYLQILILFIKNRSELPVIADNSGQSSSFSRINAKCSNAASLI
jgi:hypothetical protein